MACLYIILITLLCLIVGGWGRGGVRISRDVGVREEYLKMWGEGVDNKMEGEGGYDFYISAFTGNG